MTKLKVEISEWSPLWGGKFQRLGAEIRASLGNRAIRIDHIGSTSIRGLAAKPIIDIQVSVADFEPFGELRYGLETIGFLWRNHNPDLAKRYFRETPGDQRTHIHVRRSGSWHEQWALLFRDYMRAAPSEHKAYVDLKRRLAAEYPTDRKAYTDGKADHLWGLIRQADAWAGAIGWKPPVSDA